MSVIESPKALKYLEFIDVVFELEFQEPLVLQPGDLLLLRRELRQAASFVFADDPRGREAQHALFDPVVPDDPALRKRVQRPGPGFVIRGEAPEAASFDAGDTLELNVLFWGKAIQFLPDFARTLLGLGNSGLCSGRGMFDLLSVSASDASGRRQALWNAGDEFDDLAPPILDASWWLSCRLQAFSQDRVKLSFVTPCRLLSAGRPLFRPSLSAIFPFLLRRVTSMALVHCGVELFKDPQPLLEAIRQIQKESESLRWQDWRRLESRNGHQDLGGIIGSVLLSGASLADIGWVLHLGSLMQLGKGAAFGAGRFDLHPSQ